MDTLLPLTLEFSVIILSVQIDVEKNVCKPQFILLLLEDLVFESVSSNSKVSCPLNFGDLIFINSLHCFLSYNHYFPHYMTIMKIKDLAYESSDTTTNFNVSSGDRNNEVYLSRIVYYNLCIHSSPIHSFIHSPNVYLTSAM